MEQAKNDWLRRHLAIGHEIIYRGLKFFVLDGPEITIKVCFYP